MDVLIYGQAPPEDIKAALQEIHRILKRGGKYLSISDESPDLREPLFDIGNEHKWTVTFSSLTPEEDDNPFSLEYFLYVLSKK